MGKKDILSQLAEELPKYQIKIKGLSILPFALDISIVYLPTNQEVGYIRWTVFQGVRGVIAITLSGKKYAIMYENGEWSISEM